ncbi:hypothetical protein K443DRAFT_4686 [Laccaria amethystina LaAM-08-1]|uniref:Ribonuclease H1 N-terminal domain-containing protein n=1 Tax=Laccaria amethystina LaAM-08-1 TaxID=1095629 RepID=A0A0C9XRS3_9AGAR|nr:hypothetical protein K443DRAFT_4686 [Laccaria amethystina LaAM-08-1]
MSTVHHTHQQAKQPFFLFAPHAAQQRSSLHRSVVLLLTLDPLLTCLPFNDQIRTGPTYPVPAADDDNFSYDSSDYEEQAIHPLAEAGARSKKKAYNVYWGRQTGTFRTWSSAEIQVKYFSGACFKGYSSLEEAITEWDIAVEGGHIGPGAHCRLCHRDVLQLSTPSRDPISTPSRGSSTLGPSDTSSRGLSSMSTQPASQNITCTTPTPVCPVSRASGSSLSPSLPSSLSNSTPGPPATPSSHGSASRFASITDALEGLNIEAYYAVIRAMAGEVEQIL